MAEEEKQNIEGVKGHSFLDEKMKPLLDEISIRMDQIGEEFGPVLMEELQNRLENIVKNFNGEVKNLFSESFKKWKLTDTQLREFINSNLVLKEMQGKSKKENDEVAPAFIKDTKFGSAESK